MNDPLPMVEAVEAASNERVRTVLTSALIILDNPVLLAGREMDEFVKFLVAELDQTEEDDIAAIRATASPEEVAFYEGLGLLS